MRHFAISFLVLLVASAAFGGDSAWDPAFSKAIDAQIDASLKAKNVAPAPRADDSELVHRIYLDLLGRIPTRDETLAYLNDADPDKHHKLIDALLIHPEMPVFWRGVFNHWLNGSLPEAPANMDKFLEFLQEALAKNQPWDKIARDLIMPDIQDETTRAAAIFLTSRMKGNDKKEQLDNITTAVASVFFGVQLQCAKCHDHPFVLDWTQDHYYGLSAFFARSEAFKYKNMEVLSERAEGGEVSFITRGKEEKTAKLMFLDGKVIDEPALDNDEKSRYVNPKGKDGKPAVPVFSRREALIDYAFTPDDSYFKRSIANRVWKQLMGRGLVEPVDQMHSANPPSHPKLLDLLADDTASHGFDLHRLMAGILHSDAYLRSSRWPGEGPRPMDEVYAAAILKPLTPAQLAQSVALATGQLDTLQAKYEREKEKRKLDKVTLAVTRVLYEREREYQSFLDRFQNNGNHFEANASQALFLTYNDTVRKMLEPRGGSLTESLAKMPDIAQAVRRAYLTILSRRPSDEELAQMTAYLADEKSDRGAAIQAVAWALLTSSEFRFNH